MFALENFIKECTHRQAATFGYLREIILSCSSEIREDVKGETPCYNYMGGFCYLHNYNEGITLSFCSGNELYDPMGVLETTDIFEERAIHFKSKKEVNPDVVLPMLQQALSLNRVSADRLVYY